MIYLDNAATTKISSGALKVYNEYAEELFFNPSAIYNVAVKVKADIESAKETIKNALKVSNGNIIFTSSATESNNLAIFGSVRSNFKKAIFSMADHPSSYNVALELEKRNIQVDFCPLQANGEIDYQKFEEMCTSDVDLISIIHVSNETGAINDIKKIDEIRKRKCKNSILHVDGVQAFSKIKINVDYFGADLYTISGHKMFAPKGISALYVKNGIVLKPVTFGGGQENNIRSGTENVPAIMALKQAVNEIGNIQENFDYVKSLKQEFLSGIKDLPCTVNSTDNCSPYIISLSFRGVKGETLVHMMEQNEIYISTGSACSSKKEGNRILNSMGVRHDLIVGSIRVSFSKNNTIEEAKIASKTLKECYLSLVQKLS